MFRFDIYESNRNEELPEKVSFFKDFIISKGGVFDSSHPDIVFVFGGDGSLLNAIKIHSAHLTSFMLINAGTLGFYREYDLNELDKFYKEFDFDKLVREEHKLLEIDDIYGNKAFAVNEVMLASSIKTLDFNVYVNDKYLMEVKGSGYTFLVMDKNNKLRIINTSNQDTPYYYGFTPIMTIDVWEHAYYLKYTYLRKKYLENIFDIIDFDKVYKLYLDNIV